MKPSPDGSGDASSADRASLRANLRGLIMPVSSCSAISCLVDCVHEQEVTCVDGYEP